MAQTQRHTRGTRHGSESAQPRAQRPHSTQRIHWIHVGASSKKRSARTAASTARGPPRRCAMSAGAWRLWRRWRRWRRWRESWPFSSTAVDIPVCEGSLPAPRRLRHVEDSRVALLGDDRRGLHWLEELRRTVGPSYYTQILEGGTHTHNTTRVTNEQTHKPSDTHETQSRYSDSPASSL